MLVDVRYAHGGATGLVDMAGSPLGTRRNPGFLDPGTSALTGHAPPGPTFGPTPADIEHRAVAAARRLVSAVGGVDTRGAIGSFLGGHSFTAGVVVGMAQNLATSAVELARFFKMLALADYHESQQEHGFWQKFARMTSPVYGAMSAASYFWPEFDHEAKLAHDQRDVLFKTVSYAFEHPGEVFGHIADEQKKKYAAFKTYLERQTLSGEFHAGVLFGELLLDVLLIADGVTALARIATKIPGLLKLLPQLRDLVPVLRAPVRSAEVLAETSEAASPAARGSGKVYDAVNPTGGGPVKAAWPSSPGAIKKIGDTGNAGPTLVGVPINGATRTVPLGFNPPEQFTTAAQQLQDALVRSGVTDATVGVRGSSVTGLSVTKGTRFGPQSDIDFYIESQQLTEAYTTSKNIPGFVHPGKILPDYPLLQDWATTWTNTLGRDVTPGAFVPGTLPSQPSIVVRPIGSVSSFTGR